MLFCNFLGSLLFSRSGPGYWVLLMIIHAKNVHKSFGSNQVLRGLDLEVTKGESLVILGGSGSGKSVFLRHLVGLIQPDQGEIMVDGVDINRLSRKELFRFRQRFGMSFQDGALFDSLSAFENIAFPIRRWERGIKDKELRSRVNECLEMVGMPKVANLMPSEMSGGMKRRIGFARAIALRPKILLFDEPTTGLDPIMTSVLNMVIQSLNEHLNTTTITITHDLTSARTIADRVAMLFQGKVILDAESHDFFQSDHEVVRQFVEGRPEGPATEALRK
jgi:phospholipid/cholesterol/gamma-HCH transport system ATP-binding protein